jgi:thiol-disulfide isomerase/thioredoxin
MKYFLPLFLAASFCLSACGVRKQEAAAILPVQQTAPPAGQINFSSQETWLLGYFKAARLSQEPHSAWFIKGFDEYRFSAEAVNRLKDLITQDLQIKIVLGTWCPDSRREVPRFMRVMREIVFPEQKIEFIGVDNSKISPIENYDALNILRVPTFIFYRNNIEAGRIIENPVASLEQDMVDILTRNE